MVRADEASQRVCRLLLPPLFRADVEAFEDLLVAARLLLLLLPAVGWSSLSLSQHCLFDAVRWGVRLGLSSKHGACGNSPSPWWVRRRSKVPRSETPAECSGEPGRL